jgi:hypothetical protein
VVSKGAKKGAKRGAIRDKRTFSLISSSTLGIRDWNLNSPGAAATFTQSDLKQTEPLRLGDGLPAPMYPQFQVDVADMALDRDGGNK